MGIRVDEWDARPMDVEQPIDLGEFTALARLVFEIVQLRGAEPVGTYGADFYAGTPAVTRNNFGAGRPGTWRPPSTSPASTTSSAASSPATT